MKKNMTILCFLTCALCLALSPVRAYAQPYLFNTGEPNSGCGGLGLTPDSPQVAGSLNVPVPWTITSLEAYLINSGTPQDIEVRIYEDNSGSPGDVIFASDPIVVPRSFFAGWVGALDLELVLPPGNYWFGVAYLGSPIGLVSVGLCAPGEEFLATARFVANRFGDMWLNETNDFGYRIGGSLLTSPLPGLYYSCTGFDPPMADGPVTVKKDRALPLKAQLFDQNGNAITNIPNPPLIQVTFRSTLAQGAEDVTGDAFPVGQGTIGNQFVFTGEHWQYNLKTTNYSAPGTYRVTMVSGNRDPNNVDGYFFLPPCTAWFIIK